MNNQEFSNQVTRLREAFGDRFFNAEKSKILFSRVARLDHTTFYKGVTRVISSENYAPTIDKIIDMFSSELKILKDIEIDKLLSGHACIACSATGAVIYIHLKSQNSYAFRCNCKAGNLLRSNYPSAPLSEKEFIFHTKFKRNKIAK